MVWTTGDNIEESAEGSPLIGHPARRAAARPDWPRAEVPTSADYSAKERP